MRQYDPVGVVEDEVTGGVQGAQSRADVGGGQVQRGGESIGGLDAPRGGQLGVDEQPEVFDHGGRWSVWGHRCDLARVADTKVDSTMVRSGVVGRPRSRLSVWSVNFKASRR